MTSGYSLVEFRRWSVFGVPLLAVAAASGQQTTELVSIDSNGNQANGHCNDPSVSGDGRYVAFQTSADNLVPGDTNGDSDIFVHDRSTGGTQRVSLAPAGQQADGDSYRPSISGDGRYVAFESAATNLVPGDNNDRDDVFVHDRQTGVTQRVSVDSSGSEANAESRSASISEDGRYVAFQSSATNLVLGDANGMDDVFVHDRQTGVTELASVDSSGAQANDWAVDPAISGDGRCVAFESWATNMVQGDNNGFQDVFVHDRQTGVTELASVDSSGSQANELTESSRGFVSGDGRYVVFGSQATNLVSGDTNNRADVFVRDRLTGITERVSVDSSGNQANAASWEASISRDGRYVAFGSDASNLVLNTTFSSAGSGDDDVFVHDRLTGVTEVVSIDSSGNAPDKSSDNISVSGDGRYVAFKTRATNMGATNGLLHVYLRDRSCTADAINYCTAGTSANNCTVSLVANGTPSSSAASGFVVTALFVEGHRGGAFYFGQNGRQANPWGNGTSYQCVVPPVKRLELQTGNGTAGTCDGFISQDLNATWCEGCQKPNLIPIPSQKLQLQFWYRDPSSTSNQATSLSDAIEVTVCPGP